MNDAMKRIHIVAEEGANTMKTWSSEQLFRNTVHLTAIAVQRENAMVMLSKYT